MKSKTSLFYFVLLTVGVVVLINILANRFFFRLDLTEDNRYTLSRATKDLLRELDEPITITAYFTRKLDPSFDNIRKEFEDLLTEYHSISKGMVVYEIKNPLKDEKTEQEAQQAGVMELQVQVREDDQFKAQKAYLGAVIKMGEDSEVIPAIGQTQGMEYSLSTAIKKLSVKDKPNIGILQGHGEASLQQLQQAMYAMEVLNTIEPVYLTDSTDELEKCEALAIVAPKDSFPQSHLDQLSQFLAGGKGIFIALDRVGADESSQWGMPINTGLETWLSQWGIEVGNNYIVDVQCPTVTLQQQQGQFINIKPVQFYYFPFITNFKDHPVSSGLEQIILQFASPISYTGDTSVSYTPIAGTSERSGTKSSYSLYEVDREWTENDFPLSDLTVAAALEGKIAGPVSTRMVVVGDGDFPLGGNRGQVNPDNINLMANAVDWLSDETGLIELRTKGATMRPLDNLEEGKRKFLKYFNFLLPLVLVIIYGIFRMQRNQLKKVKRMEVGYV
ncbi:MAG: Gldg family protein [Bacteroidales bacterium]|nr:Gldg family protein [Bacteroidales bacterium]MBN2763955.1 Gldg family protein [Bacteroidales bacterium]